MSRGHRSALADYWRGVPHSRIRHDVTDSPAWRVLGFSPKALYADLRAKLGPTNNGNINATLSEMKHRGWTASATLAKALRELEGMGFIAKTRQGGIGAMSKQCSLYRFTDLPVFEHPKQGIDEMPETFDYRRFESVAEAERAVHEIGSREKSKVQKLKLLGSDSEAMTPSKASESEQEGRSKLQKLNKGNWPKTRAIAGGSGK